MKAAVVTFPGSNCDDDTVFALSRFAGFQVDRIWHKGTPDLSTYSLVVLPGGFSYGDYLRCGAIAALSPVMSSIRDFAQNGGRVLGICNGFQILCEAGLLPGALAINERQRFICRDTGLRVHTPKAPWTSRWTQGADVSFPIAHGDGRYWIDPQGLKDLEHGGQILFKYADNPNGSVGDIAGICNSTGNVLGLMPHPERATGLRSGDGMRLWESIKDTVGAGGGAKA